MKTQVHPTDGKGQRLSQDNTKDKSKSRELPPNPKPNIHDTLRVIHKHSMPATAAENKENTKQKKVTPKDGVYEDLRMNPLEIHINDEKRASVAYELANPSVKPDAHEYEVLQAKPMISRPNKSSSKK